VATAECVIPIDTHCGECAAKIAVRIRRIGGVTEARTEHPEGLAIVRFDPDEIPAADARAAVSRVAEATMHRPRPHAHGNGDGILQAVAATCWVAGIGFLLLPTSVSLFGVAPVSTSVLLLAAVVGGWPILRGAVRSLRRGRLGVNALIAVATIGAAVLGEFFEAASLVVLFGLSESLEHRAKRRAHHAAEGLLDVTPDTAIVLRNGRRLELPVEAVDIGESVLVRPGDRVGLDGVVTSGRSWVNEAAVTGEGTPVSKQRGDSVFAGSLNGEGALEVETTHTAETSTLARIAELVSQAMANRPKVQRAVDRFARVYTPVVVGMAVLLAVVPIALGQPVRPWVLRALTLLVVSCPCAFVISLPATIAAALTAGARSGLVIKGGEHLERAAATRVAAFDKTGTLTTGDLEIEALPAEGHDAEEVLRLAAALEAGSEHLIGQAILRGVADLDLPPVDDFRALPGLGVTGTIEGVTHLLGKPDLFAPDVVASAGALGEEGRVVLLGTGTELLGGIRLRDRIRREAARVISDLAQLGVRSVMVTGDRARSAEACGETVGIGEIHSDLMPEEKQAVIERLRATGVVCMVGDGINDAPSLAAADVGVAMGLGAATTADAADVVLSDGGLGGVTKLIRLARRAFRVARGNMIVALALKVAVAGLALGGVSSLALAVIVGDVGATILVTINAVRLSRVRL